MMFGSGSKKSSIGLAVLVFLAAAGYFHLPVAASNDDKTVSDPELQNIVQRMAERLMQNHARIRPYTLTRSYLVYGHDESNPKGQVLAKVNFLPPDQKSYDIAQSSGGMSEKVVRRVLEREVEVAKDPESVMMIPQNYNFTLLGEEDFRGHHCYLLHARPRREDKNLLKADVWVDSANYEIVHVEGEPAKSPSFWIRDVHVVMDFGEISGMWLQTATQAVAHVRFAGEYKMNSHDLDVEVAPVVAAGNTPDAASAKTEKTAAALASNRPPHRGRATRHTTPLLADGIGWNSR